MESFKPLKKFIGIISKNPALAKDAIIFMFIPMKTAALISLLMASTALAQVQHATATWIASKNATTGGQIQTVIQMKVDAGWHTYWKNPGEGGIPLKILAKLPSDWKLGEIQYPAPKRYTTGELPSIGYGGEVFLPITIYPPKGASSDGKLPEIRANLSWLTCNESSCVPGEANLILSATGDPAVIQKAYDNTPKPLEGAKLAFVADKNHVTLTLTLPDKSKIDPTTYDVFPVTPDAISAASELRFRPTEGKPSTWTATGKSSEYLDMKINSLTVEMFKTGEPAWSITSKNK
jgi:DsbC/DsbD-like thiol-disulfide interchange protein